MILSLNNATMKHSRTAKSSTKPAERPEDFRNPIRPQKRFTMNLEISGHTKEEVIDMVNDIMIRVQVEEAWNSVGSYGFIRLLERDDAPGKEEYDKQLDVYVEHLKSLRNTEEAPA